MTAGQTLAAPLLEAVLGFDGVTTAPLEAALGEAALTADDVPAVLALAAAHTGLARAGATWILRRLAKRRGPLGRVWSPAVRAQLWALLDEDGPARSQDTGQDRGQDTGQPGGGHAAGAHWSTALHVLQAATDAPIDASDAVYLPAARAHLEHPRPFVRASATGLLVLLHGAAGTFHAAAGRADHARVRSAYNKGPASVRARVRQALKAAKLGTAQDALGLAPH